ncbi:AI-2E family transporter [Metabacillus litoralis]|uniref:AI-2E family transporter n=1 Tax=Metabacillus litoralis TaxID=152268 RepID=UPI001CFCBB4A|nr:AI-2E family transporter [Metabacillus litoralis]
MWIKHSFFKYLTAAILVLIVLLLLGKLDYLVEPILTLIETLFLPILIAGFFYYLIRPVVLFVEKPRFINRPVSIFLVFGLIVGGLTGLVYSMGDVVQTQINQITTELPSTFEESVGKTEKYINENNIPFLETENVRETVFSYLTDSVENLSSHIVDVLSAIANFATVLIIVPFILFYLLKDDDRFSPYLLKFIPENHEKEGKRILSDIHTTLSTYIVGQMIVACVNGVLMYIGYLIIGLDYALVLALFVVITAIVPILGPLLGVLPALFVGLMYDPFMLVKIGIVLLIVQQLEGNLVSPLVIGNRLKLHPLTIILLLLAAGSMYGFIGILIVIPVYSVFKVTINNAIRFYKLRYS